MNELRKVFFIIIFFNYYYNFNMAFVFQLGYDAIHRQRVLFSTEECNGFPSWDPPGTILPQKFSKVKLMKLSVFILFWYKLLLGFIF